MVGKVILIGAGPGDKGLLTLRGQEAILEADVILFDRLVGPEILAMMPQTAEQIDVGKNAGNHPVPQEEINGLILERAKAGKTVVRIKGGDPYLFGRGAEELEAVLEAKIPFEVVPGVTSAIAVPAYGGIPITHRDYSSSLHIVTAHAKRGTETTIDFESLVKVGGTIVFMMGVGAIPTLTQGLLEAGMSPEMPAALVEKGTTAEQRKLVSTVGEIAQKAKEEEIQPPSVFVVGKVCQLSNQLDWFSTRPLSGVSVMVTRPRTTASKLSKQLRDLGANVLEYPCIYTEEIPMTADVAESLPSFQWLVFTSALGVELFFKGIGTHHVDIRQLASAKIAAVGTETANALTSRGLLVDYIPPVFDAEHLGQGLSQIIQPDEKVLLFRAAMANPILEEILEERGITPVDIPAYDTFYKNPVAPEMKEKILAGEVDYVTFTSGSTVEAFVHSMHDLDCSKVRGLCIGQQTAKRAEECGIQTIVSEKATIASMVEKIVECEKNRGK